MATQQKLFLIAAGLAIFLLGCAEPCDCLKYERATGYHYECAVYKSGYCQQTRSVPYEYDRCVQCKEGTAAPKEESSAQ